MILTEAEAKTKLCSERFKSTDPVAAPGFSPSYQPVYTSHQVAICAAPAHCMGSACMAWRVWDALDGTGYCGKAGPV